MSRPGAKITRVGVESNIHEAVDRWPWIEFTCWWGRDVDSYVVVGKAWTYDGRQISARREVTELDLRSRLVPFQKALMMAVETAVEAIAAELTAEVFGSHVEVYEGNTRKRPVIRTRAAQAFLAGGWLCCLIAVAALVLSLFIEADDVAGIALAVALAIIGLVVIGLYGRVMWSGIEDLERKLKL